MSWQTRNQLGREARQGASLPAPVEAPAAAEPSTPTRTFGFQSGAVNSPVAKVHEAEAIQAGAELGEPTSFRGGAGAPAPVAITRGIRTTFQNPAADQGEGGGYVQTPGSSPQEFATETQARQAYNRGMAQNATAEADARGLTDPSIPARYGTYQPAGATLAQITAEKEGPGARQERLAKGEVLDEAKKAAELKNRQDREKEHVSRFDQELHGTDYATFNPTKGATEFKPDNPELAYDANAARNVARSEGWEAGIQHLNGRQMARKYLQTQELPMNFNVTAYLNAVAQDKDAWKELLDKTRKAAITPGQPPKVGVFRSIGNFLGNAPPYNPEVPPAG